MSASKKVLLYYFKFRNSIVIGLGLSIGMGMGYLFAVSVGTLNTFSSGSTVSSSQINSNFTTLKTAIEQNMVPVGTIVSYGGSIAPTGFLLCDGSEVSRTTYADLFNAIGTTWGSGDGSNTFNLPDTRTASPTGAGSSDEHKFTQTESLDLATYHNDQFQGHVHQLRLYGAPAGAMSDLIGNAATGSSNVGFSRSNLTQTAIISDGTNDTPRIGNVTKGKQFVVNFIIKY